jgi:hypothetical protein
MISKVNMFVAFFTAEGLVCLVAGFVHLTSIFLGMERKARRRNQAHVQAGTPCITMKAEETTQDSGRRM